MDARASPRRHPPFWTFIVVGVVVASVLFVTEGPPGALLPRGTHCELGAEVGNYTIWTPLQLINIPDGGNVSYANDEWNITVTSGSLVLNALTPQRGPIIGGFEGGSGENRAGLWVMYGDFNWTIYDASNSTSIGGASGPCTQPYVAELMTPGGACGGWYVVGLPDNTTDVGEPHIWNGTSTFNGTETYPGCPVQTSGTWVWFDSAFHGDRVGNDATIDWNLCGVPGYRSLVLNGIAEVPEILHVPFQGRSIAVTATLAWTNNRAISTIQGATAGYLVPGGWNWTIAPVGPAAFPIDPNEPLPSLVAFVRSAC
jgi:hypothetical protein